jgi:hypothetical protein
MFSARNFGGKLAENNKTWKDIQYLVDWVDSINQWVEDFQIYEFIKADKGEDPSGRIPSMHTAGELPIDTRLVWSVFDSTSEVVITSEYFTGAGSSSGTLGWFLGRVPHGDKRIVFDYLRTVCELCEGEVWFETEGGDEEECEKCLENPQVLWLEDTDFELLRR